MVLEVFWWYRSCVHSNTSSLLLLTLSLLFQAALKEWFFPEFLRNQWRWKQFNYIKISKPNHLNNVDRERRHSSREKLPWSLRRNRVLTTTEVSASWFYGGDKVFKKVGYKLKLLCIGGIIAGTNSLCQSPGDIIWVLYHDPAFAIPNFGTCRQLSSHLHSVNTSRKLQSNSRICSLRRGDWMNTKLKTVRWLECGGGPGWGRDYLSVEGGLVKSDSWRMPMWRYGNTARKCSVKGVCNTHIEHLDVHSVSLLVCGQTQDCWPMDEKTPNSFSLVAGSTKLFNRQIAF